MKQKNNGTTNTAVAKKGSWLYAIPFALLTVFLGWVFFAATLVPHLQMHAYKVETDFALNQDNLQPLLTDTFVFRGNDYAQGIMRAALISSIFDEENKDNSSVPSPLLDYAIKEMDAYDAQYPYRYDYYLDAAKAYDLEAVLNQDQSYAETARKDYEMALSLIHDRQDVIYPYANNLFNLGFQQQAIALIQQSIAENPSIVEGHYRLGELYTLAGPSDYTEALGELELALNAKFNPDPVLIKQMYDKFLRYYYAQVDIPHFKTVVERLVLINPSESGPYNAVLAYINTNGTLPIINITDAN